MEKLANATREALYQQIEQNISNGIYSRNEMDPKFPKDCMALLRAAGASEAQASRAYAHAYDEGHSSGYSEILLYADALADIFAAK